MMLKTLTLRGTLSLGPIDVETELEVQYDFDYGIRGPSIFRVAETQRKLEPVDAYSFLGGFDKANELLSEMWLEADEPRAEYAAALGQEQFS